MHNANDDIRDKVLTENTAQAVYKHLQAFESIRADAGKRWVWELLQNALDASATTARVECDGKTVVFSHNGEPFTIDQLCHLIYHGSTKSEDEKSIGRFGSGFLTTHLLSYSVNVSGRLDDGRSFDFPLQRNPESISALRDSMNDSWECAKDSFQSRPGRSERPDGSFDTEFEYMIDAHKVQSVDDVLDAFKRHASLLLIFNRNLSDIIVQSKGAEFAATVRSREPTDLQGLEMMSIRQQIDGRDTESRYLHMEGCKGSVAIPLTKNEAGFSCQALEDTPRLFLGFPLIGTDDFCMPFVGNSFDFSATEPRDGIYLGKSDNEDNRKNEGIVTELCDLYIEMLRYVADQRYGNIYNLATFPQNRGRSWLDNEWRQKHVRWLIARIRNTPAILCLDAPLAPKGAVLPFAKDEAGTKVLWGLLSNMRDLGARLPLQLEILGWRRAIQSWTEVGVTNTIDQFQEAFGARKTGNHIAKVATVDNKNYGSLEVLEEFLADDVDSIDWLDRLYVFLCKYDTGMLEEYNLVLDRSGFLHRIQHLYRDAGIDKELTTIADDILKLCIKANLRDTRFACLSDKTGKGDYGNDNVVREIRTKLDALADQGDSDEAFYLASARLFGWIVRNDELEHLLNYPVFSLMSEESDRNVIRLQKIESLDDPLSGPLAPPKAWPINLQPFVEVFLPDRILANEFFDALDDRTMWQKLEDKGFVRANILFKRTEVIKFSAYLPDDPLPDSEISHEAKQPVEVTDIARFTTDRIRASRRRAALFLQFMIQYLSVHDRLGLSIRETACACGEKHGYYPAAWLRQVVRNRWVPVGKDRRDVVNAQSINQLLMDTDGVQALMGDEPGIDRLLEAIRIDKLALGIEAAARGEVSQTRIKEAMAGILHAVGGDYIVAVAEDFRDDQDLPAILEKRRQDRQQVLDNQRLGQRVEELVRESLEHRGFTVRRVRVGADLEMKSDVNVEVEKDDRMWLVEIKATRGASVRMTAAQARAAVKAGSGFILCVVPVESDDGELPELDLGIVRRDMRFVLDIAEKVKSLCEKLDDIENRQGAALSGEEGGVKLEITGTTARIVVDSSVWTEGVRLEELSAYLV